MAVVTDLTEGCITRYELVSCGLANDGVYFTSYTCDVGELLNQECVSISSERRVFEIKSDQMFSESSIGSLIDGVKNQIEEIEPRDESRG